MAACQKYIQSATKKYLNIFIFMFVVLVTTFDMNARICR